VSSLPQLILSPIIVLQLLYTIIEVEYDNDFEKFAQATEIQKQLAIPSPNGVIQRGCHALQKVQGISYTSAWHVPYTLI